MADFVSPRQPTLFDAPEAHRRREEGIARVALANPEWIARARTEACRIACERGEVTADDVREVLYPKYPAPSPNAWGAIFRCKRFVKTGARRLSKVPQGHGNEQRVWKLREEEELARG